MRKEAKVSDDVKVEEVSENESDVSQVLAAYKRYEIITQIKSLIIPNLIPFCYDGHWFSSLSEI